MNSHVPEICHALPPRFSSRLRGGLSIFNFGSPIFHGGCAPPTKAQLLNVLGIIFLQRGVHGFLFYLVGSWQTVTGSQYFRRTRGRWFARRGFCTCHTRKHCNERGGRHGYGERHHTVPEIGTGSGSIDCNDGAKHMFYV